MVAVALSRANAGSWAVASKEARAMRAMTSMVDVDLDIWVSA
jgi:hypothetical protein